MEFVFGDHRLDVDRRELWRGAELIAVEPQVLDLLVYLLQNRDRVVSKNDLLDAVWGGRTVSESTLTSRINAVRKAVGDNGRAQQLIRTVPRKGVRFVGIVCEHPKPAAPINARPIVGIDPPNPALARADQRSIDAKIGLAWLTRLGLEQYERAFRDNDVDAEVLPELTAEDLIGLGVTSVGHRRILLAAIATLRDKPTRAGERNAPITALASKEVPSGSPSSSAERRQLTVMFCDLVGSTELAARLDPEDLLEVISAYHRAVTEIVSGFDGFVAKYMGDGVPVYFGYPRAHEDDAERAVRVPGWR